MGCGNVCGCVGMCSDLWLCWDVGCGRVCGWDAVGSEVMLGCGLGMVGCGWVCGYVGMWDWDLWLCWNVVGSVVMLGCGIGFVFMLACGLGMLGCDWICDYVGCGQICGYVGTRSGNPCSNYVLLSLSVICNLLQSVDYVTMLRPCSSDRS